MTGLGPRKTYNQVRLSYAKFICTPWVWSEVLAGLEGSRVLLSMELFGEFLGKVWENNFRPQMKTSPLVWVKVHHFFLSSWMGRVQGVVVNGNIWGFSWKGLGKKFQTPDENLAIGMGESPSFFPF